MKKCCLISILIFAVFVLISCQNRNPNIDKTGTDQLKSLEVNHLVDKKEMVFQDLIYVPIYSDIYVDAQNPKSLLSATLSIRNTSHEDSLFISKIDYFNTHGGLVKHFIERPISISPMATVNYVIEKDDDTGGPGANFMVSLSARNGKVRPLIQAVMIGHDGNMGFAFSTNGLSLTK